MMMMMLMVTVGVRSASFPDVNNNVGKVGRRKGARKSSLIPDRPPKIQAQKISDRLASPNVALSCPICTADNSALDETTTTT